MQRRAVITSIVVSCSSLGYCAGNLFPLVPSSMTKQLRQIESKVSAWDRESASDRGAQDMPGIVHIDWSPLRTEVMAAVRDEMRKYQPGTARPIAPEVEVESPTPSAESIAAYNEGERLINSAIRSHRWRDDDAQAFRNVMSQLGAEQQQALLKQLTPRLNSGEIRSETSGSPS